MGGILPIKNISIFLLQPFYKPVFYRLDMHRLNNSTDQHLLYACLPLLLKQDFVLSSRA